MVIGLSRPWQESSNLRYLNVLGIKRDGMTLNSTEVWGAGVVESATKKRVGLAAKAAAERSSTPSFVSLTQP